MSSLFVVEADPIVALDIAETLGERFPLSHVHVFETLTDAEQALDSIDRPRLAVVSINETGSLWPVLHDRLARLSDRVVVIADDTPPPNVLKAGWSTLLRPFSAEMLVRAALRLCAACRPAGLS